MTHYEVLIFHIGTILLYSNRELVILLCTYSSKKNCHIILQFLIYLLVEMFTFFTIPEIYYLSSTSECMPNLIFISNIIVHVCC